jgi:hypothetical protein
VSAADPPLAVIVLTTVIWQMMPSPPELPTPVLHAPVAASGAADAGEAVTSNPAASSAKATRPRKRSVNERRVCTPAENRRALTAAVVGPAVTTVRST